jgi:hypothetical protein
VADLASDPGARGVAPAVQPGSDRGLPDGSGSSQPAAPPDPSAATTDEVPPAGGGDATATSSWKPDILDADNHTRVVHLETGAVEPDSRAVLPRGPASAPPPAGEAPAGEDHDPLPQPQPPSEGSL